MVIVNWIVGVQLTPIHLKIWVWILELVGLDFIFYVSYCYLKLSAQKEKLSTSLSAVERHVKEADERVEDIFQVSKRFVEAIDENELIYPVLRSLVKITGAMGVSFVPLDKHGQPHTAISQGQLPSPLLDTWVEYLASPGVRNRCANCNEQEKMGTPGDCPLLKGMFANSTGLICLSVRWGEREFGIFNLFFDDRSSLDDRTRLYLRTLVDKITLGFEGVRLRRNERAALSQIKLIRAKTDLPGLLNTLMESVYQTLEADFILVFIQGEKENQSTIDFVIGEYPPQARSFLNTIIQGVMVSGKPVILEEVSGDHKVITGLNTNVKSIATVPISIQASKFTGVVLLGNRKARNFNQRHFALLQTIAGQLALILQYSNLLAEIEFKILIHERMRLAREIHDGLAQTVGDLKLQAAQLKNYLLQGEIERVQEAVDRFYSVLNETYQDVRQMIDGLRIAPDESGVQGWLTRSVDEFRDLCGVPVELKVDIQSDFPPEVKAQFVRIIQEALDNVYKHADARQIWVGCKEHNHDIIMEVRDNGNGFSVEDLPGAY